MKNLTNRQADEIFAAERKAEAEREKANIRAANKRAEFIYQNEGGANSLTGRKG